ncbi:MAG: hypothetical protein LW698_11115 [Planctomycetaceae bacterium]|nr:hypothetical protein [Planctomycetaceae bacterium]
MASTSAAVQRRSKAAAAMIPPTRATASALPTTGRALTSACRSQIAAGPAAAK